MGVEWGTAGGLIIEGHSPAATGTSMRWAVMVLHLKGASEADLSHVKENLGTGVIPLWFSPLWPPHLPRVLWPNQRESQWAGVPAKSGLEKLAPASQSVCGWPRLSGHREGPDSQRQICG